MVPMSITFDHVVLPSRDGLASANFLADLLGLPMPIPDGPDGDLFPVQLDGAAQLIFVTVSSFDSHHLALRVDDATFGRVVARLKAAGLAFGNDPESPQNGLTVDSHGGGRGRVYFTDPNGHLLELCC